MSKNSQQTPLALAKAYLQERLAIVEGVLETTLANKDLFEDLQRQERITSFTRQRDELKAEIQKLQSAKTLTASQAQHVADHYGITLPADLEDKDSLATLLKCRQLQLEKTSFKP